MTERCESRASEHVRRYFIIAMTQTLSKSFQFNIPLLKIFRIGWEDQIFASPCS